MNRRRAARGACLLGILTLWPIQAAVGGEGVSPPVVPAAPVRSERVRNEQPLHEAAAAAVTSGPLGPNNTLASPGAAARPDLMRADLQPGMVLREWRVPSPAAFAPVAAAVNASDTRWQGPVAVVPVRDEGFPPCAPNTYPAPVYYPNGDAPPPPPPPGGEVPLSEQPGNTYLVPMAPQIAPNAPPLLRSQSPGWDPSPLRNGDCGSPCAQRRDDCCWPLDCSGCRYGRWDLRAEIGFSSITQPEEVLGEPIFGPLAGDQFDWGAMNYGYELDFRLGVTYAVAPQKRVQVRAQWFGSYEDSTSQSGGRFAFTPGPTGTGGVSDPVDGVLQSETDLWTAEINYISEFSCSGNWRWDLIAGLRLLQLEDDARVDFSPNAGIAAFTGPAYIVSETDNFFIGFQAGVGANWDVSPTFVITGSFKGMLGNISREASVSDQSIFVGGPHASSNDEDELVLGAEVELGVLWRITPRLGVTATYTLLMLDGVLRGYDAMDFTHSTSGAVQARQQTDQLVTHSLFLGLNFNI